MSKVTSKRQVTIPKAVADRYHIQPGDEVEWVPAGEEIRVLVSGQGSATDLSAEERLSLFDEATARRDRRQAEGETPTGQPGRRWTREELYDRGGAG